MKNISTPTNQNIANKAILVRVDYNVPLKKVNGKMTVVEPERIEDSIPTIKFLLKNNCRVILMSHLGRPSGKVVKKLSLKPVADYLKTEFNFPVLFSSKTVGAEVEKKAKALEPGQILLLENLRFHAEEKKNDKEFAQQLAKLADAYINDAFSTSHRAHASISSVPKFLPAFAGFHIMQEIAHLADLMKNPKHPFVMIIGGAKISDKVEAVQNLCQYADLVLVGGGVANNFLKAGGLETHKSYLEEKPGDKSREGNNYVKVASNLIEENKTERILKDGYIPLPKLLFPTDVIAAENKDSKKTEVVDLSRGMKDTPDDKDLMYLDIGPKTIKLYKELILQAETIFWNGPMGVFEKEQFSQGTKEIARAIAKSAAYTVIGGGDTIAAIKKFTKEDRFDYVSSAGGASLAFLAGKKLPGLEAVKKSG
ncbi:MAG: phosphoglycerate kinase [Patescibacteria group bacterium]|nr:phosphoglycerate kinase [Patescibacteria group bacterium]